MQKAFVIPCLIAVALSLSTGAYACSCVGGITITKEYKDTEAVFIGTVQNVQHNENRFKSGNDILVGPGTIDVYFKVTRALKGVKLGEIVAVRTPDQGPACGIENWMT